MSSVCLADTEGKAENDKGAITWKRGYRSGRNRPEALEGQFERLRNGPLLSIDR